MCNKNSVKFQLQTNGITKNRNEPYRDILLLLINKYIIPQGPYIITQTKILG